MYTIAARNVNFALKSGLERLNAAGQKVSPRGLETIELPLPVATTYLEPNECVLFHPIRDINPFFHLMEALGVLAGRQDVEYLDLFNSSIKKYSDDGKVFHAAYGHRLQNHFYLDDYCYRSSSLPQLNQLHEVIKILQKDPCSRQAVLTIWDPTQDLNSSAKDIPCNTQAYVKLRRGALNLTVCCRSNDMIWGAYGTNCVQFSFILQFLAAALKVPVGTYTQISDSFHVYTSNPQYQRLLATLCDWPRDPYQSCEVTTYPLIDDWRTFEKEVRQFCDHPCHYEWVYEEPFLANVARPLAYIYFKHREWVLNGRWDSGPPPFVNTGLPRDINLQVMANLIRSSLWSVDWVAASFRWLERHERLVNPICIAEDLDNV